MNIRDSDIIPYFLFLYIYQMKKIMQEKNQVVPDEVLSKEFLSQFKTEADVSKFLKQLHAHIILQLRIYAFLFHKSTLIILYHLPTVVFHFRVPFKSSIR